MLYLQLLHLPNWDPFAGSINLTLGGIDKRARVIPYRLFRRLAAQKCVPRRTPYSTPEYSTGRVEQRASSFNTDDLPKMEADRVRQTRYESARGILHDGRRAAQRVIMLFNNSAPRVYSYTLAC